MDVLEAVLDQLGHLPPERQQEVLDFTLFLLERERSGQPGGQLAAPIAIGPRGEGATPAGKSPGLDQADEWQSVAARYEQHRGRPKGRRWRGKPKGIEHLLGKKRDAILRLCDKHGAHNVRVFGSVARGEAGPRSDIDLLVDTASETSPFFPGGLIADLEDLLGRRVDVVTLEGLHPKIRDLVQAEAVEL